MAQTIAQMLKGHIAPAGANTLSFRAAGKLFTYRSDLGKFYAGSREVPAEEVRKLVEETYSTGMRG